MQIRWMEQADIDRVMAIAAKLNEAPRWTREMYAQATNRAATPMRMALVAENGEAGVVGFAITLLIPPQAELETVAVAQTAQRKGIATLLFSALNAELKELQITEVILEVRESNRRARAFYGSVGFTEVGRRHGYYTEPQEDALLLRRPCANHTKVGG
jgi:ribosomal-protein-alanine N-acetyltransferase